MKKVICLMFIMCGIWFIPTQASAAAMDDYKIYDLVCREVIIEPNYSPIDTSLAIQNKVQNECSYISNLLVDFNFWGDYEVENPIALKVIQYYEPIARKNKLAELSAEEWECLYRVSRSEAGEWSREGQMNVAWVVLNRVYSKSWPNNIIDVVFQKGQFEVIAVKLYYRVTIDDFTIKNVQDAYLSYVPGESAQGAEFFRQGGNFSWATFIFEDEVGHRFFK